MDLPELSDLAWGILERAAGPLGMVFGQASPGARDALVAEGLAERVILTPAGKSTSRKRGNPPIYGLRPTEKGRNLLAHRKEVLRRAMESP